MNHGHVKTICEGQQSAMILPLLERFLPFVADELAADQATITDLYQLPATGRGSSPDRHPGRPTSAWPTKAKTSQTKGICFFKAAYKAVGDL